MLARLDDLKIIVVRPRKHRRTCRGPENAALGEGPTFGTIGGMLRHPRASLLYARPRFRRERGSAAIRRIHDQRCSPATDNLCAAIPPKIVVPERHVRLGVARTAIHV